MEYQIEYTSSLFQLTDLINKWASQGYVLAFPIQQFRNDTGVIYREKDQRDNELRYVATMIKAPPSGS